MPRQVMADRESGIIRVRAPKVQDSRVAASNTVTLVKPGAMVVQHGRTGRRSHIPPNVGGWYAVQPCCVYSSTLRPYVGQ